MLGPSPKVKTVCGAEALPQGCRREPSRGADHVIWDFLGAFKSPDLWNLLQHPTLIHVPCLNTHKWTVKTSGHCHPSLGVETPVSLTRWPPARAQTVPVQHTHGAMTPTPPRVHLTRGMDTKAKYKLEARLGRPLWWSQCSEEDTAVACLSVMGHFPTGRN